MALAGAGGDARLKLFFDLDGTLTDSGLGITRSVQHALTRLGRTAPDDAALRHVVGPPLRGSFAELLGTRDEAAIDGAIALYRERYVATGMFENEVYPGVPEGLARLHHGGHALVLVTSKPRVFAERILAHFALERWFCGVYGSELSGVNADKADLIRVALLAEGAAPGAVWMIGDRVHDVAGARANGVGTVGVLWGYGSRGELEQAQPDLLVASMGELCDAVERGGP